MFPVVNDFRNFVFFMGLIIIPIILYSRLKKKPSIRLTKNYKFFALFQNGGFNSPNRHFIVHAFKTQTERDEWVTLINISQRQRYNNSDTYALSITNEDIHLRKALADVKNNPIVYSNIDYLNQRIYIEHND
jgi:hypothetical protein